MTELMRAKRAGVVLTTAALVSLSSACGRWDGTFSGSFQPGEKSTSADTSQFQPEEVKRLQYKLARCSGGFLSSGSDCKLTYWEVNAASSKSDVKRRQLVFRMHGYPEEARSFMVGGQNEPSCSIEYLEYPITPSSTELPPTWEATAGTLVTRNVTERGFAFELSGADFNGEFVVSGTGTLNAPDPKYDPTK